MSGRLLDTAKMKVCGLYFLMLCLVACGDSETSTLKEPGAEGPLHITIWDLEKNKKTQIEASQLDLIGSNFSKMHLHRPKIRMPLMNGYLWLATQEAFIDQGRNEALDIKDVIYLEGLVDGRQLKGTAQALSMQAGAQHCDLSDADFIWGKQHVTVKVLRLRSGSVLEGEQWHEKPVQDSAAIQ